MRVHTDKENSYSYGIARFSMPFPRRWVLMGRAAGARMGAGGAPMAAARHPSGVRGRGGKGMPVASHRSVPAECLGAIRGEAAFSLGRLRTFCCKNLCIC